MFSEGLGKAGDMWARQRWEKVSSWLGEGNQFPCGLDPTLAQASDPEVREAWTENSDVFGPSFLIFKFSLW
jgi:hypothetical protein